ncbi:MAG: T9SS type A sorting domain-containing protein [Ignavibacteriaceae bacterium]|nr:T9SS type A sorting domain-containing protein [Ignavibacteriaceae bacterium]
MAGNLIIAQFNPFDKEYELHKFVQRGGKVEALSPNIYKLTYRTGESRTFYFNSKVNIAEYDEPVDTTIINVWEIDTTKYNNMFKFWQQVEVANLWWAPLPVEDLNNNGHPELYGYTDIIYPNLTGPVKIFERNTSGIYQEVFTYDSVTVYVKGIAHMYPNFDTKIFTNAFIDEDSVSYNIYPIYKSDTAGTLPTKFDTYFYRDTLQINNMAFGDWDKNGKTDCAFIVGAGLQQCIIAEYRDSITNFEELFRFITTGEGDLSGFVIEDFDQDEKNELVISTGAGNVFVIKNIDENQYSIVNQFHFPVHNTYMQTATNDIDGNGKPEFWIGGQDYENGITIFQCYEFDGDNNYQVVAYIELRYLVSLFNEYIQAVDIDDDGKEELIISIGNDILILKFGGYPNNHQYKLWYVKHGEATQPGAGFYPTAVADLDGDGKKDLLIPMEKYTPWITYAFSYILRRDGTSAIEDSETKNSLSKEYIKSYPVPFNSFSSIRFAISDESPVKIKVYNSLGKEIKTLLEEQLSPGEYNIQWEARDRYGSPLPSGIYLISLQTKNVVKTIKTILLK